jgi:E3 ubiquitin-protein ligase FANCL
LPSFLTIADDCAICYAARMDGALPDRVCDNVHCSKPFHRACLFEWLRALPRAQQTFDTVFGVCPYCSADISCKAPGR